MVGSHESTDNFFEGKRSWSKIKDQILGDYMTPYLAKVKKRGSIALIDAFAGPGKFDDGSPGSPLIMCQAAEKHAPGECVAIFINKKKEHHDRLKETLAGFIERKRAVVIHGTAQDLLSQVAPLLLDRSVFLYLDPFGLKGCEASVLEPFLQRSTAYSTEIVINLSIPIMHRLAARHKVAEGVDNQIVHSFHRRLDRVLGGDYWKEILLDDSRNADAKAQEVMATYRQRILGSDHPDTYTGSCPVRESETGALKYYVTFYSRHPAALLLMNEAMCKAYNRRMHEDATEGTLFFNTDWKTMRDTHQLESIILDLVSGTPGKSRCDYWLEIAQKHFMKFLCSEYRQAVKGLIKNSRLGFHDVKGTGRLNDQSILYIKPATATPSDTVG